MKIEILYTLFLVTLIVRAQLKSIRLKCNQKILDLRTSAKTVLENDLKRVWISFYESYLFVYDNAKTMPNDKEFLNFRDTFILMFRHIIGNKQCLIYDEIFGGATHFNLYLQSEFEKQFKQVFIGKIADAVIKAE